MNNTLQICIQYGLITRTHNSYKIAPILNKYFAAQEIADTDNLTHSAAMRRVNALLDRIACGLDPSKDNRGGARKGAGRKAKQPSPTERPRHNH